MEPSLDGPCTLPADASEGVSLCYIWVCGIQLSAVSEEVRLTLMPRACPLFEEPANIIGIQLHHVLPKVHGIVATIPRSLCCIIDVPTGEEYAAV